MHCHDCPIPPASPALGRSGAKPASPAAAASAASGVVIPRGFTLIDLLVAVVLIGILMSVALPAFREQMARGRRVDAQSALLEDAAYLQHYYEAHDAYRGAQPPALPAAASPRDGGASYLIAVAVPAEDGGSYVLTATRSGAMRGDRCGDLTYDSLGRKGLAAGTFDIGLSTAACWR